MRARDLEWKIYVDVDLGMDYFPYYKKTELVGCIAAQGKRQTSTDLLEIRKGNWMQRLNSHIYHDRRWV